MKTVHLLFVLCLVGSPAMASNAKVDSLKRLLQSREDIDRAEVLWGIAYELFDVDNLQALFYAERAYHEVWPRGDSLQIVKVGTTYGQLLRRVGKVDRSIEVSSCLLPTAKRNGYKRHVGLLLTSLTASYTYKERFSNALECIYENLRLKVLEKDSTGITTAIQNIGFVLYKTGDYRESMQYSLQSYVLAKRFSMKEAVINACFNIASAYAGMNKHDSARSFFLTSLKYVHDLRVNHPLLENIYQSYAYSLLELKSLDSANYYALKAINLGRRTSNPWAVSMSYILLSKAALETGNKELCWRMILNSDSLNSTMDFTFPKILAIKQKSKYFSAIGDHATSSKYLESYYLKSDSIYSEKEGERIKLVQVAFNQRVNRERILVQAELMTLKDSIIEKNNKFLVVISIGLAIVLVQAVLLYRSNQRKELINKMLDMRVVERTRELGIERDLLKYHNDRQEIFNKRIHRDLIALINSLNGLLYLARVDSDRNIVSNLDKANDITSQLSLVASKLKVEKKMQKDQPQSTED